MKTNLRILLIEDSVADATLISERLKADGFSFRLSQVQTEFELHRELDLEKPDLVLSDHGFPAFSGFTALEIVRERHPKLPFIFVSGSNSQEMIIDMIDRGATDYVFKRDIHDLKLAVCNALESEPEDVPRPAQSDPPPPDKVLAAPRPVHAPSRLQFCPECQNMRNEGSDFVWAADYFQSHPEVTVVRKLCDHCAQMRASG